MRNGWLFTLMFYLLCYLFLCTTVVAQETSPKVIRAENAAGYVGKIVKINAAVYQTQDEGQTLTVIFNNRKQALTLLLTGEIREKIWNDMQVRRELNTQIKSPLDTSITATGEIMFRGGCLIMQIGRASAIYLGADLTIQKP